MLMGTIRITAEEKLLVDFVLQHLQLYESWRKLMLWNRKHCRYLKEDVYSIRGVDLSGVRTNGNGNSQERRILKYMEKEAQLEEENQVYLDRMTFVDSLLDVPVWKQTDREFLDHLMQSFSTYEAKGKQMYFSEGAVRNRAKVLIMRAIEQREADAEKGVERM